MKSIHKTNAQRVWGTLSEKLDGVLKLLDAAETVGQADVAEIPLRVAAEADRLSKEQPRTSRVSRADLEEHARSYIVAEVSDRIRVAAPAVRKDLNRELAGLKQLVADERRVARAPRPPTVRIAESEKYAPHLPESRAIRLGLDILNARLELAGYSIPELVDVLRDDLSDDAQRYVAEGALARGLTRPPVYDVGHIGDPEKVADAKGKIDQARADADATLRAVRDARVPEPARKREAAVDSMIAAIDARVHRVARPLELARELAAPIPEPGPTGLALQRSCETAREALSEAVRVETLAEMAEP